MSWTDETAIHVTHASNLTTIRELGLRPAAHWIDRAVGLDDATRRALHESVRSRSIRLVQPGGRTVWLRDQKPLARGNLADLLVDDLTEAAFLRLLNKRVYLFPNRDAASVLVRRYRQHGPQVLLLFHVSRLLEEVSHLIELSAYNTGAIGRTKVAYKGSTQFMPLHAWGARQPREITLVSPGLAKDQLDDFLEDIEYLKAD